MGTVSVSLPADGTGADVSDYNTPITTIVNEINGSLDNSNIASGAAIAGSKLADSAITAEKIATSAICLGFAQRTSSFATSSTSAVLITDLSCSVTIPAGGRRIKITGYIPQTGNTAISTVRAIIWDGTVGSGTALNVWRELHAIAGNTIGINIMAVHTPSAGAKTYNLSIECDTGTETIGATATQPAFLLVEAI